MKDDIIDDSDEAMGGTLVISTPEELIGSVPSFLGFAPENGSVVVLCERLADGGGGPVLRLDVPELLAPDYLPSRWEAADFLRKYCLREGVLNVFLILVFEDCMDTGAGSDRATECIDAITFWLDGVGTQVSGAYGVESFGDGLPWTDFDSSIPGLWTGKQIDPASTEIAAMRTMRGIADLGSRDEIEKLYQQRDPDAQDRGVRPYRSVGLPTARREYALYGRLVGEFELEGELDDDKLRAAGAALRIKLVRDQLLQDVCNSPLREHDGRRDLWWRIVRRRPGDERAEAMVLLGAAAYLSGDGVHARAAFEEALASNPTCRLAEMYLHALMSGVSPSRIREAAGSGDVL